jgi:hypothetical protein
MVTAGTPLAIAAAAPKFDSDPQTPPTWLTRSAWLPQLSAKGA